MDSLVYPSNIFGKYFNNDVYEPAEDTFLLIDAIEKDIEEIKVEKPLIVVEIGCGSGSVIGSLIKAINSDSTIFFATDINPVALEATEEAIKVNNIPRQHLELLNCDLINCCHGRLDHCVDVLIFNPPYVVTVDCEIPGVGDPKLLAASWAGGKDGMKITSRFLKTLPRLLSDRGRFYLVLIKENKIDTIIEELKNVNIDAKIAMERKCGREHLFVLTGRRKGS